MDTDTAGVEARQAADSVWLERAVRVGLVAYGLVHIVIAVLALQIAFGNGSHSANQQGAFHAVAKQPFGRGLLWVVALGMFMLAVWQATEAVWGHRHDEGLKRVVTRLGSAAMVAIYGFIGYSAAKVAVGAGARSHSKEWTARLMALPLGRLLVAVVGVVIVVIAVMLVVRGIRADFDSNLDTATAHRLPVDAVVRVGQVGYISKGVAFGVIGGLFFWAALSYDAKRAGGLDVALTTLTRAPAGPVLLAVVAAGIGCFGVYCFGWATYVDTTDR